MRAGRVEVQAGQTNSTNYSRGREMPEARGVKAPLTRSITFRLGRVDDYCQPNIPRHSTFATLHSSNQISSSYNKMDSLVAQYTQPAFAQETHITEDEETYADSIPPLSLKFALPPISQASSFLRAMTDDASNPNCPIKIAHGTTTLAFRFKGGIIVATDSRATAGSWIASQTVKKVIEINPMLLGTMAGGAAVSCYT